MIPIDMALVTALTKMKAKAGDLAAFSEIPGGTFIGLAIAHPPSSPNPQAEARIRFDLSYKFGGDADRTTTRLTGSDIDQRELI